MGPYFHPNIKADTLSVTSVVILLQLIPHFTNGQSFHLGPCINWPVQANFSVERYLGRWYTVEQYMNLGSAAVCVESKYASNDYVKKTFGEQSFIMYRTHLTAFGWTLETEVAFLKNGSEPGKYTVTSPTKEAVENPENQVSYWILGTDYENYSVVRSCERLAAFNLQIVRFLSRTQTPSREVRRQAYIVMRRYGLSRRLLVRMPQGICPGPLPAGDQQAHKNGTRITEIDSEKDSFDLLEDEEAEVIPQTNNSMTAP